MFITVSEQDGNLSCDRVLARRKHLILLVGMHSFMEGQGRPRKRRRQKHHVG